MSIKDPSIRAATLEENAALEEHIRLTYDTDLDTETRRNKIIRVGSRPCRVKYTRGAVQFNYYALADAEQQLAAYKAEGYNTVLIDDASGYANGTWTRISEADVKTALDLARKYEMGVIVYMYFSESTGLGVAAATTDEIKERVGLYVKYDQGEVLGVTGMYLDNFLVGDTLLEQKRWYDAVKEVSSSLSVYSIFGLDTAVVVDEPTLDATFSPACFDHILLYTLPYYATNNFAGAGAILAAVAAIDETFDPSPLDSGSADSQERLTQYMTACFSVAAYKLLDKIKQHQLVLPVVETIKVATDPSTKAPSPQCVETMASVSLSEIQTYTGAVENNALLFYKWGGAADDPLGLGHIDGSAWRVAVRSMNKYARLLNDEQVDNHRACRLAYLILNVR